MVVDHDLRHVRVPDEGLERPQPHHAVADLIDDPGLLLVGEGQVLFVQQLAKPPVDDVLKIALRHGRIAQLGTERLDQTGLEPRLDLGGAVQVPRLSQSFSE